VQFQFATVLVILLASAAFVGVSLLAGLLVRPRVPNAEKRTIYDCGERPIGSAWFNFNPRFYVMALVFIIFDVEIALTFPAAVVVRAWMIAGRAWFAVAEIGLFLVVLVLALAYVWGKGDLDWVRDVDEPEDEP
jgi:NADH-quinone oxidoreductase subunit A